MNDQQLEESFGPYRKPNEFTIPKYDLIQKEVYQLARTIQEHCPESREKAVALTQLQTVKMFANAAVAIHTKPE